MSENDYCLSEFLPTRVLVWRLEQEAPCLLDLCREAGVPVDDLLDLPAKRLRERAAERLLLCRALGQPVTLCHDRQGAPFVQGMDVNVSITHTTGLVAIALDDARTIGLDAERTDRPQVIKVRDKFLNAGEQQFIAADDLAAHVIAWTAKEAVIKAERNSRIDWTEGIRLEPFAAQTDETTLVARCGDRRYRVLARAVDGHYITLAVPDDDQTPSLAQ